MRGKTLTWLIILSDDFSLSPATQLTRHDRSDADSEMDLTGPPSQDNARREQRESAINHLLYNVFTGPASITWGGPPTTAPLQPGIRRAFCRLVSPGPRGMGPRARPFPAMPCPPAAQDADSAQGARTGSRGGGGGGGGTGETKGAIRGLIFVGSSYIALRGDTSLCPCPLCGGCSPRTFLCAGIPLRGNFSSSPSICDF